jgi:hypothetical protein
MCSLPDPRDAFKEPEKFITDAADPTGVARKLPGSPAAAIAGLAAGASGEASFKPYGEEVSVGDIAGGGTKMSQDESDREVGRTIGTLVAMYFGAAAAMNAGAAPAATGAAGGAAGGTGITVGATGAAGITPGAVGAVGITPAAGAGATMGAGAAAVGTAAAVPAAEGAAPAAAPEAAAAPAAKTASAGITLKDAAQAVSIISSLAPLFVGKPSGQASPDAPEAPTAPPTATSDTGIAPTAAQLKGRKKLGDPTALTGPGGIPFDSLTLGRATILGG